jgi:hypothetical protein
MRRDAGEEGDEATDVAGHDDAGVVRANDL